MATGKPKSMNDLSHWILFFVLKWLDNFLVLMIAQNRQNRKKKYLINREFHPATPNLEKFFLRPEEERHKGRSKSLWSRCFFCPRKEFEVFHLFFVPCFSWQLAKLMTVNSLDPLQKPKMSAKIGQNWVLLCFLWKKIMTQFGSRNMDPTRQILNTVSNLLKLK